MHNLPEGQQEGNVEAPVSSERRPTIPVDEMIRGNTQEEEGREDPKQATEGKERTAEHQLPLLEEQDRKG